MKALIAGIISGWFLLGVIMCHLNGWIAQKALSRYFDSREAMNKDLMDRNRKGGFREPTDLDLVLNAFFWPRTLYFAWRGQQKIIRELESRKEKF